jgi:hypothetical protein
MFSIYPSIFLYRNENKRGIPYLKFEIWPYPFNNSVRHLGIKQEQVRFRKKAIQEVMQNIKSLYCNFFDTTLWIKILYVIYQLCFNSWHTNIQDHWSRHLFPKGTCCLWQHHWIFSVSFTNYEVPNSQIHPINYLNQPV